MCVCVCVCIYANMCSYPLVFWSISETTVHVTSTSEITLTPGTMNSSVQSQTSLAITVSFTPTNFSTSSVTLEPSLLPGNGSDPPYNSTSLVTSPTEYYTSLSPTPSRNDTPSTIKVCELGQQWQTAPLLHMYANSLFPSTSPHPNQ